MNPVAVIQGSSNSGVAVGRRIPRYGDHWLVMVLLLFPAPAAAQDIWSQLEDSLVASIERSEPCVVSVARIESPERSGENDSLQEAISGNAVDPLQPGFVPNSFGSGVLVSMEASPERLVLTNYHLVRGGQVEGAKQPDGDRLFIRFANRRGCDAVIRAADPRSDLAVLALRWPADEPGFRELPAVVLGRGELLRKGQLVISIGNPWALAHDGSSSVSLGMIGNTGRRAAGPIALGSTAERSVETLHQFGTLLQVDLRRIPGTSGGALVDRQGQLVGISTAMPTLSGLDQSLGYAIPVDEFTRRLIADLSQGYEIEYGFLGVQMSEADREQLNQLPSFRAAAPRIDSVIPNSAAELGGLRRGDIVLEIGGTAVYTPDDVTRTVGRLEPAAACRLKVLRGSGPELQLSVQLGKWPVQDDLGIVSTRYRVPAIAGMTVDYPTARSRYLEGLQYLRAVLVLSVEPGSPAEIQQIRPGDFISHVNGQAISTPRQFLESVQQNRQELVCQFVDSRGPVRTVTLKLAP